MKRLDMEKIVHGLANPIVLLEKSLQVSLESVTRFAHNYESSIFVIAGKWQGQAKMSGCISKERSART